MNEHSFSAKILGKTRKAGIAKAWKINDLYAGGVPDAWFLGNKDDLWIEFKWIKDLPKRESTIIKPDLSPLQLAWINKLYTSGKNIIIVIGYPKWALLFTKPYEWENGILLENICKLHHSLNHNELVNWIINKIN